MEGNTFDPDDIDTSEFLERGFLDIDHMAHNAGIREAIVGKPVAVWKDKGRLFARFLLNPTQLGRDIYEYCKAHPGVLSFSIAGLVQKPLYDRGGKWSLQSCAITHVPKQPDAYAIALSGAGMTLRGAMSAFAADLKHGTVRADSLSALYDYFKPMTGPVMAFQLATWAYKKPEIRYAASQAPVDLMTEFRQNLFYPEDEVESAVLDERAHLTKWKLFHPEDTHIDDKGRYNSLEDAVAHLRYCERLNPIQVAHRIGRLRGRDDIIKGISKTHGAA